MDNLIYCLLAGGRGERLNPLTQDRPKPLVRFGANARIIGPEAQAVIEKPLSIEKQEQSWQGFSF